MRVDTKEVVRRQLRALGNDRFELGIQHRDTGAMELRILSVESILGSVGFLKWKNQSGHFIRIRPKWPHPFVFIDDLSLGGVYALDRRGFAPSVVVESSPENFQVWLNLGRRVGKELMTLIARQVASTLAADQGAANWRQAGALAGFTFATPGDQRVRLLVRDNFGLGTQTDLIVPVSVPGPAPGTLTLRVNGNGVVTSDPLGISCRPDCQEDYASGTRVELTATPNAGSAFAGWGGIPDCGDGNVVMNVAKTCEADFVPLEQLTVTVVGNGLVASVPPGIACPPTCEMDVPSQSGVRLNVTPDAGWEFNDFSGDADCTDGFLAVTGPVSCTVTFRPISSESRLDLIVTGPGEVLWPDGPGCRAGPSGVCSQSFPNGAVVTLDTVPDASGRFTVWGDDCTPFASTAKINVALDRDMACTATFDLIPTLDFSLDVEATTLPLNAVSGVADTSVTVTRTTYLEAIELRVDDCPVNVQCLLTDVTIPRGQNMTTLTFIATNATPGNYVVTVGGNGGGTIRQDWIELRVQ